jgi:hypothetical protein
MSQFRGSKSRPGRFAPPASRERSRRCAGPLSYILPWPSFPCLYYTIFSKPQQRPGEFHPQAKSKAGSCTACYAPRSGARRSAPLRLAPTADSRQHNRGRGREDQDNDGRGGPIIPFPGVVRIVFRGRGKDREVVQTENNQAGVERQDQPFEGLPPGSQAGKSRAQRCRQNPGQPNRAEAAWKAAKGRISACSSSHSHLTDWYSLFLCLSLMGV